MGPCCCCCCPQVTINLLADDSNPVDAWRPPPSTFMGAAGAWPWLCAPGGWAGPSLNALGCMPGLMCSWLGQVPRSTTCAQGRVLELTCSRLGLAPHSAPRAGGRILDAKAKQPGARGRPYLAPYFWPLPNRARHQGRSQPWHLYSMSVEASFVVGRAALACACIARTWAPHASLASANVAAGPAGAA